METNHTDNHDDQALLSTSTSSELKTEYPYVFRRKTRCELLRMCSGITGVDYTTAAMSAVMSPLMLKLHIPVSYMTWIWVIPPIFGMIFNPLLGSVSDRCRSPLGRRRPLILSLTAVILAGLLLLDYGYNVGQMMGDNCDPFREHTICNVGTNNSNLSTTSNTECHTLNCNSTMNATSISMKKDKAKFYHEGLNQSEKLSNGTFFERNPCFRNQICPVAITLTIIGLILVDFGNEGIQSPFRTYVIDLCTKEDQVKGLSMFALISGAGGITGYLIGGIDWAYFTGKDSFLTQVHVILGIGLLMNLGCVLLTVTSFKEIPLAKLRASEEGYELLQSIDDDTCHPDEETESDRTKKRGKETFLDYFKSIFLLPRCIILVCATNLFLWMGESTLLLYFTDFVGQAVCGGSPTAPEGTESSRLYNEGVRLGSLALALYDVVGTVYALVIEKLVTKCGIRITYALGPAVMMIAVAIMAVARTRLSILLLAPPAGICCATLYTLPYIAITMYHEHEMFKDGDQIRGIGTDVALVTSMLQVGQIIICLFMGALVHATGTTVTVMVTIVVALFIGILLSTQIPLVENKSS